MTPNPNPNPNPNRNPTQVLLAFLLKSATQSVRPLLARRVLWPLRLLARRKLRALLPPRLSPGGGAPAGGEQLRARSRWQQVTLTLTLPLTLTLTLTLTLPLTQPYP